MVIAPKLKPPVKTTPTPSTAVWADASTVNTGVVVGNASMIVRALSPVIISLVSDVSVSVPIVEAPLEEFKVSVSIPFSEVTRPVVCAIFMTLTVTASAVPLTSVRVIVVPNAESLIVTPTDLEMPWTVLAAVEP